jgi:hypothetical protein
VQQTLKTWKGRLLHVLMMCLCFRSGGESVFASHSFFHFTNDWLVTQTDRHDLSQHMVRVLVAHRLVGPTKNTMDTAHYHQIW